MLYFPEVSVALIRRFQSFLHRIMKLGGKRQNGNEKDDGCHQDKFFRFNWDLVKQLNMRKFNLPLRIVDLLSAASQRRVLKLLAFSEQKTVEAHCVPHRSVNDSSEPAKGNLSFN